MMFYSVLGFGNEREGPYQAVVWFFDVCMFSNTVSPNTAQHAFIVENAYMYLWFPEQGTFINFTN